MNQGVGIEGQVVGPQLNREGIKALRGIWAEAPGGGTDELLEERRRERELEDLKAQRQAVGPR